MKKPFYILLLVPLFFISCKDDGPKIIKGFYHWKSDFNITESQENLLSRLEVEELYVKYFDVVWQDGEAIPVAEVNFVSPTNLSVKPVIYITTEVISESDSISLKRLASDIADKIYSIHSNKALTEIQIDCDWTPSIKDKYFYLLEKIGAEFKDIVISATIRLYQYKYPNIAGVPPVDKGLLMYYNMGDLLDYKETNSILNNDIGKQYLGFNEYPIPIDIALPNFKWSLLFRKGEFQQICPNFSLTELNDTSLFVLNNDLYTFKTDTVIDNVYFRFGDQLRYEYCSENDLIEAANILVNEINQDVTRIIFYDLQIDTPADYEKLDIVYSAFD